MQRVLEATQVVYYLVHSLGSPDFEERDRQAAEIVAREAERADVAQIIYLGGLGDDARPLAPSAQPDRDWPAAGIGQGPGDRAARGHGDRPRERGL